MHHPVEVLPFACIGHKTIINENTHLGSNVVIGNNCKIGKNCIIHPQVVLYDHTEVGDNTIIHSGAIIGADGFGYIDVDGIHQKIPHKGSVDIGNNVEIGANTTIDKGCLSKTIIADGVKIDNLVQVGHNVTIGKHSVIVANSVIGGSTSIGEHCILAGSVSVSDNIRIGNNATILGRSAVSKHIKDNQVVSGFPAQDHKKEQLYQASLRRMVRSTIEKKS